MASRDNKYDMEMKLLLIGDSGVGKTSLLLRYANDSFSPTFITTIGIDFKIKTVLLDGKKIKLKIWDSAGQERFRTITHSYFKGTQGIILTADCTDFNSLISTMKWIKDIEDHAEKNVDIIVVANKGDAHQHRIDTDEFQEFVSYCGYPYFEVSAKQDIDVEIAFLTIATMVKNSCIGEAGTSNFDAVPVDIAVLRPKLWNKKILGWNSRKQMIEVKIELEDCFGLVKTATYTGYFPIILLETVDETVCVTTSARCIVDETKQLYSAWTEPTIFHVGSMRIGIANTALVQTKAFKRKRLLFTYTLYFGHSQWRPHWVADELSPQRCDCGKTFGLFSRRHHCRDCGKCACIKCCPKNQLTTVSGYEQPVRVCKKCFQRASFDKTIREGRSFPGKIDFAVDAWNCVSKYPGIELDEVVAHNGQYDTPELIPFAEGATAFIFRGKFYGVKVAVKQYKGGYLELKRPTSNTSHCELRDPLFIEVGILRLMSRNPYCLKLVVCSIDFEVSYPFVATELESDYGSLQDVLSNRALSLPWTWRMLALSQIMAALWYLEKNSFAHLDLKPQNCMVVSLDYNRFQRPLDHPIECENENIVLLQTSFPVIIKIFDFNSSDHYGMKTYDDLYGICRTSTHSPPETLIPGKTDLMLNSSYDVYSFGIMMAEVASRSLIFEDQQSLEQSVAEMERAIIRGCRPLITPCTDSSDSNTIPKNYLSLVSDCWSSTATLRPTPTIALNRLVEMMMATEQLVPQLRSEGNEATQQLPLFIVGLRSKAFKKSSVLTAIRNGSSKSVAELCEKKLPELKAIDEVELNNSSTYICSSPGGQFIRNMVYQRHFQRSRNCYIPISEFANRMLDEKEQEFMGILQALGARSIQIFSQERKERELKGHVNLGIGYGQMGVEGESSANLQTHRGCMRDFGKSPTTPKPSFDPLRPYLFYPHETSWKGLVKARLEAFLQTTKVVFSFNSTEFVSASVVAKCSDLGLSIGGSVLNSVTLSHEYMIEFFTEEDYHRANTTRVIQYWHLNTVLRFLDFLQLSELRETFAKWAITGKDLLSLLTDEFAFSAKYDLSLEFSRRVVAALREVISGSSDFE